MVCGIPEYRCRLLRRFADIIQAQLKAIIKAYPLAGIIYDLDQTFKTALNSREPGRLESWMQSASELNIPEINAFISGLQTDLDAVKTRCALIIKTARLNATLIS